MELVYLIWGIYKYFGMSAFWRARIWKPAEKIVARERVYK
jgi:hypothetical protein